jgi:multiple sugar transport system substrate-binding protein
MIKGRLFVSRLSVNSSIDNPWWGPALYAMERIDKNAYLSNQVWNLSRQQMNQDIERMIKGEAGVEETLSRWAEIVS